VSATPRTGGGGPPARVAVLLSTYNGERYLPEFLTSLDSQSYTHVHLCVRDDGSTDGTVRLLEAHARRRAVSLHRGAHVGVPLSYFHLLRDADDADLFAFSDQDDVWLPHKIERAVRHLERAQPGRAALYCSAVRPVDADLRPIGEPMQPGRGLDFRNALVENRASGCTLVLNRAARALLARAIPRAAQMHDHWAYLVVSAFGSVFHDPLPGLLYRQHHGNEVGVPRGWRSRLAGLRRRGGLARLFSQAEEFRALYGDSLNPTLRRVLDEFLDSRHAGLRQRLAYASRCEVYRQSHLDDLALRGLIAMAYS
jgi:hypothetical protein